MAEPVSPDDPYRNQIRNVQIIATALITGILAFAGVAFFIVKTQGKVQDFPLMVYFAIGFFVVELVLSILVPRFITKKNVDQIAHGTWAPAAQSESVPDTDAGKLLSVFQTQMIVGRALLEGAAFFGLIAYLITGDAWALIPPAAAVVMMILTFPTRLKIRYWLEAQLAYVDHARQMDELMGE